MIDKKVLPNGNIKLTAAEGLIDIKAKKWCSEAVTKPENESRYVEATLENKELYGIQA